MIFSWDISCLESHGWWYFSLLMSTWLGPPKKVQHVQKLGINAINLRDSVDLFNIISGKVHKKSSKKLILFFFGHKYKSFDKSDGTSFYVIHNWTFELDLM